MARDFARASYHTKAWKNTRDAYMRMQRGLCERCLENGMVRPAQIVHHKIHLSPSNINDPEISLGFVNLEALCRECHAAEHPEIYGWNAPKEPARVAFDENGNVVRIGVEGLNAR